MIAGVVPAGKEARAGQRCVVLVCLWCSHASVPCLCVRDDSCRKKVRCDVAVVIASFPHQGCRSCALRVHEVQVPGKSVSTSGLSFSYQARAV